MSFLFPPADYGHWRSLDRQDRKLWLKAASDLFFRRAESRDFAVGKSRDVFTIDGAYIRDLLDFFCAMGEAVNGPGGYFGSNTLSFDDCLFGGFGLESGAKIEWKNSRLSASTLDAEALAEFCRDEITMIDSIEAASGFDVDVRAWRVGQLEEALNGRRTLFDELVSTIRSIPGRYSAKPDWSITLVLD